MTTATYSPIDVTDTYRNDRTMARASLRFFRAKDGRFVVETDIATECESMYRFFATIEDAREGWMIARGNLKRLGYTDRIDRDVRTKPYRRTA